MLHKTHELSEIILCLCAFSQEGLYLALVSQRDP